MNPKFQQNNLRYYQMNVLPEKDIYSRHLKINSPLAPMSSRMRKEQLWPNRVLTPPFSRQSKKRNYVGKRGGHTTVIHSPKNGPKN